MEATNTSFMRKSLSMAFAVAFASATFFLGGCSSEPKERVDAAIVVQNTQNAPTWDETVLNDCIAQVRASGGKVTVTIADSNPSSVTFDFAEEAGSQLNQDRLERKLHEALKQEADDPGVDVLKSIEVGAESIAGSENALGVFVISSGIADTGLLQMATSNLVEADAVQVADFYEAKHELPDLAWVKTVTWYGLGATAGAQGAPSNAQQASIQALYQAVLEKCGTSLSVQNRAVARPEPREGNLPAVQVVEFAPAVAYVPPVDANDADAASTVEFSSTQLGFVGDGVEFTDPDQAAEALGTIADQLKANPHLMATVTCSAASFPWKEGYSQKLSERRAAAVCAALRDMGVDESQLTSLGIGNGGNTDDIDPETGLQDPQKAAEKRKTVIELHTTTEA